MQNNPKSIAILLTLFIGITLYVGVLAYGQMQEKIIEIENYRKQLETRYESR